jgi:predicted RNase H-like nuclease (RuvC/YqgF family)
MTHHEAIAIVRNHDRGTVRQERDAALWRAFGNVIAADRVHAEHEKRLDAVTEEVKQLQVKHAELAASVKDIRARLDRFRADLARQAVVRARLPRIDGQRSDVGRSP